MDPIAQQVQEEESHCLLICSFHGLDKMYTRHQLWDPKEDTFNFYPTS